MPNPNHKPAGHADGGQFAKGNGAVNAMIRKGAGKGNMKDVTLYQGRGIAGLPLANEDGYIYASTNRNLAREYSGVNDNHYPNRDIPQTMSEMQGEIRTVQFETENPLVVDAKETQGSRDKERIIIEQAKLDGYDSVIFKGSAGGDTYVTWLMDKVKLQKSETDKPKIVFHKG